MNFFFFVLHMTIVVVNNVNSSTDVISERISKRIEKDQFLNTSFQHGFSSQKKPYLQQYQLRTNSENNLTNNTRYTLKHPPPLKKRPYASRIVRLYNVTTGVFQIHISVNHHVVWLAQSLLSNQLLVLTVNLQRNDDKFRSAHFNNAKCTIILGNLNDEMPSTSHN